MLKVVVIGAGIGGLSTAAVLARTGADVTVLEAHVYPGGCAGTFYHQGYRFDAGATLAGGFYPGGPMDVLAQMAGIPRWPGRSADPAMLVHLPTGVPIARWAGNRRWDERRAAFGEAALSFWRWQESTADALWKVALHLPTWPPQSFPDIQDLTIAGIGWLHDTSSAQRKGLPYLVADTLRPAASHLQGLPERLRLFVDAQLLISAQAVSQEANALYAAAALDLPRRGVFHLEGGMGTIAHLLAQAVRENNGQVLYRQEAMHIRLKGGRPVAVETRRGDVFHADLIVANLTPWNVAALLGENAPLRLRRMLGHPARKWGAFVVYLGLDSSAIPVNLPLHHQVIQGRPLSEGNSLFLSISPEWDERRAPPGKRALTLSTHTDLKSWWHLFEANPAAYQARRAQYTNRLLASAERVLPDLRQAAELVLPGTPVTFQRFTRRSRGWVGGFPQTDLLRAWGPKLGPNLWMVGDSIFPGQSVPAAALGGLRIARSILREHKVSETQPDVNWEPAV